MLDFFLLGHNSLLHHRITHISMLWFHKNKGHGALFSCVVCSCWVLHHALVSATSICTTTGHPVVLSSEKGQNYEGDIWVPHYGYHICSHLNLLKVKPIRSSDKNQMLDTIFSLRWLSSFTQTSFESKKIYMAKDSILTALCLCTFLSRALYKECKHTHDLTQMWVALDLCRINKNLTPLILSLCTLSQRP